MRAHNQKGLSLTELIVASILIAIIMVGITSFNFAIKRIENSTVRSSTGAVRVAAAMNQLSRDAAAAVGEEDDPGIIWTANPASTTQHICFRQDVNDPRVYTDDIWVCYEHGGSRGINRCFGDTAGGYPTANCTDTTKKDLITITQNTFYSVVLDEATNKVYIELTLVTRYDPSAPADTINNPEITLTTRISPVGHTW